MPGRRRRPVYLDVHLPGMSRRTRLLIVLTVLLSILAAVTIRSIAYFRELSRQMVVSDATDLMTLCINDTISRKFAGEEYGYDYFVDIVYDSAGAATSATASDRLNIPAKAASAASSAEKPVPNVVVQKFEYGGKPVAAGGRFPLSFTFENTGTAKVENIVVTVDGGECFTVDGGSNTAHYDALGAGKALTQEMPMQAVPTCKSGAQAVTVSFKYEYVDAGKRSAVTSDIRLSVPVSQPDRFQLNQPAAATFTAGEEGEVTLAYVNKGRADIGNLEAQLVGEGFESPAKVQYLGNVAAGASGSIGFALTPEAAGKLDLAIKVTYEDADLQTQTKEFPLSLTVEEGAPEPDFAPDDADLPPDRPAWLPVIPATAALAAAAGTAFFLAKRLRRKAAEGGPAADAWSWAEDPGEDEPQQPKEE